MCSECTHLMFIDADIGFNPQDVLALLALQTDESDYDIIGVWFVAIGMKSGSINYAGLAGGSDLWIQNSSDAGEMERISRA